jgi:hypothetical protein
MLWSGVALVAGIITMVAYARDTHVTTPTPPILPDGTTPPDKTPFYKRPLGIVVLTLVGLGVIGSIAGGMTESETTTTTVASVEATTTVAAETTTTVAAVETAEIETIEDLTAAVEATGYECDVNTPREANEYATDSLDCTSAVVLAIHDNEENARAQAEARMALMASFTDDPTNYTLIGPNWSVNCGDDEALCEDLQAELGGEIYVPELLTDTTLPTDIADETVALQMSVIAFRLADINTRVSDAATDTAGGLMTFPEFAAVMDSVLVDVRAIEREWNGLDVPASLADAHNEFGTGLGLMIEAIQMARDGAATLDIPLIEEGTETLLIANGYFERAADMLPE